MGGDLAPFQQDKDGKKKDCPQTSLCQNLEPVFGSMLSLKSKDAIYFFAEHFLIHAKISHPLVEFMRRCKVEDPFERVAIKVVFRAKLGNRHPFANGDNHFLRLLLLLPGPEAARYGGYRNYCGEDNYE
ncbi:MAG TPA: hypothetical protein VMW24_22530 [Sedimentisphaerales bacterium]|nr:hypothetical protein [Sedimentisphaerales bacterium]